MNTASPDPEAIARELEALGEAPASAEELTLVRGEQFEDEPALATFARLTELAEPLEFDELSELETHRAWRRVEQEIQAPTAANADASPSETSPRRWLFALTGLAAAAAVALIVVPRDSEDGLSAEEVAQQGESVRRALAVLDDGRSDSDRARDRARAYQQRLEERGG